MTDTTPPDKRINWPATSQALAEKLDALDQQVQAHVNATPRTAAGYADVQVDESGLATLPLGQYFAAPPIVVCTLASAGGVGPTAVRVWNNSQFPNAVTLKIDGFSAGSIVGVFFMASDAQGAFH